MWKLYITVMRTLFAKSDKERFFNKFSARLRAGAKLMVIIDDMIARRNQRKGKFENYSDPTYAFLLHARQEFASGKDISDIFKGWVSPSQIVLIRTGEETGRIVEAFDDCVELEKDLATISSMVKKSLRMPVIAIVGLLALLNAAYQKGIPLLVGIEPDLSKWGSASTFFYDVVNKFGKEPFVTACWVLAVVAFYVISLPNLSFKSMPQFRVTLNRIVPFFEIYRQLQASVFLKSFATLFGAGVRINSALELVGTNSVKYVRDCVETMQEKVSQGRDVALMFESELLMEDGDDLYDMAKSAELQKALDMVSKASMAEVMEKLPTKLDILGKALIVICILIIMSGIAGLFEIVDAVSSAQ
ncbi:type II secretion system F family protein [Photobacterium damselae]|uniref:type II secretion system F family protein n=1 Tax=Photobacterium damselae TaxID=38293 RepID=UPI0040688C03